MTLSDLSIRRPVFAWMLMAALILFGWISFRGLGISQLPDVDFPVINVGVGYEGAAPEVMEADVVDPIEDALMTVQGVRSVRSTSRNGAANITVEFNLDRNIDVALQEVQSKIAQTQRNLPKEIDPPVITKTNPEDQPILWLTISSETLQGRELMLFVRDRIKDQFTTVEGVGEVFLGGYVEPNLRVWVSSQKLEDYELSVGDVLASLKSGHSELPAGQVQTNREEIDVRTMGEARTVEDFERLIITERGGRPNYANVRLGQVSRVEEGLAEVRRLSRVNGLPAIGLGFRKQRGTNAVEVAKLVKARMTEVQKTLPRGTTLAVNFDSTKFIEDSVSELQFTLLLSALLTGIVCWLFLGSFSSTFNVLLAIPTSIIGSFMAIKFAGFTLNTFTLLGLSLAVGIVVDDAIMVLENIVRHREKGLTRMDAALVGAREITFAAVAATIAIVAIFLPVAFMRGVIGKFFLQFGVTMTVTVLLSLLEALTLTPMRCSRFVDVASRASFLGRGIERVLAALSNGYLRLLRLALRARWAVVILGIAFFAGSLAVVGKINKEFVPAQDQGNFMIRLQTPVESSIQYTDAKFREAEAAIGKHPALARYFVAVGGFGGGEVNTGIVFVTLKPIGRRGIDPTTRKEYTQQSLMDSFRASLSKIPDVKVFVQDLSMRGFSASRGFPVEFTIRGPDWDELASRAEAITKGMSESGLMTDVDTDYRLGKPEIRVIPERERAALRGVSIRSISETVSALVGGVVTGKYSAAGRRYDIRVRLTPDERDEGDKIRRLQVRNNRGELVRLADVATIESRKTLQQIARVDRERAISIFANIAPGKSQAQALEAAQAISRKALPEGYRAVMSGSAQTFKESFQDLLFALVLGLGVAYMVLASQFNSFIDPVTVLLALPFSLSGAFLALFATHQSINIYSFIGIILLMGIVKKNSILLVEFTHQIRVRTGATVRDALLDACPIRLRPILMTSIATIAGAVPPALALGPGAETRVPMAIAVIGGVLVSTVLTLFIVPAAHLIFADIAAWVSRIRERRQRPPAELETGSVAGAARTPGAAGVDLLLLICAGASIATAAQAGDSPAPKAWTLGEAMNYALTHQASLGAARARVPESEAQESLAWSRVLPQVSADVTATHRKDGVITGSALFGGDPYNKYGAELTASQLLFSWAAIRGIELPKRDTDLRRADVALAERDLQKKTASAFFDVQLAEQRLELLATSARLRRESLRTTEKRQKIGRSQRIDVLQIRTELALLEARIAQAKTEIQVKTADLAQLMGLPEISELRLQGTFAFAPSARIREAASRLESRIVETERARKAEARLAIERSATLALHYPELRLQGSISRASYTKTDLFDQAATGWTLGLRLDIPLFSGLSSWRERQVFAARQQGLETETATVSNQVRLRQAQTAEYLRLAQENVRASEQALALSRDSMKLAEEDYRNSTLDFLQLLAIEQSDLDAEISVLQAKHDFALAVVQYFEAYGLPFGTLEAVLQGDEKRGSSG